MSAAVNYVKVSVRSEHPPFDSECFRGPSKSLPPRSSSSDPTNERTEQWIWTWSNERERIMALASANAKAMEVRDRLRASNPKWSQDQIAAKVRISTWKPAVLGVGSIA